VPLIAAWFSVTVATSAQSTDGSTDSKHMGFHIGMAGGAALALGNTPRTMDTGGALTVGPSFDRGGRWWYPIDVYIVFSNVPGSVLQGTGIANGSVDFLGFAFDPSFTVVQGRRWGAYVSGGGGLSWKQVQLWATGDSCQDDYYCNPTASESSFQGLLDGGAGVTYRIGRTGRNSIFAETRLIEMFSPAGQFPGFNAAGTRLLLPQMGWRF
jgi:hypothetical protein